MRRFDHLGRDNRIDDPILLVVTVLCLGQADCQQQGSQGLNIGRLSSLAAGFPTSVSGMTLDRQCSSGMMAIATAAKQIIDDGMSVVVGGGLESISLVQNENMNIHRMVDEELMKMHPNIHMPMLQTAEVVLLGKGAQ